ncbi:MAG TPA: hypothetical protein PKC84_13980, partial [Paracoccaceae bacterium]|nr:hypothetical protein [Paracoccaceae bacterium]
MTEPATAPLTLAAVLDHCLRSVVAGSASVPAGTRPHFGEPGMELRTWVATEAGDALLLFRPTAANVTGCELWGGDFSDPDARFSISWRDRGTELLAWIDAMAARPEAIDLRGHPDYEAVFLCDGPGRDPIALGASSFRPED